MREDTHGVIALIICIAMSGNGHQIHLMRLLPGELYVEQAGTKSRSKEIYFSVQVSMWMRKEEMLVFGVAGGLRTSSDEICKCGS